MWLGAGDRLGLWCWLGVTLTAAEGLGIISCSSSVMGFSFGHSECGTKLSLSGLSLSGLSLSRYLYCMFDRDNPEKLEFYAVSFRSGVVVQTHLFWSFHIFCTC